MQFYEFSSEDAEVVITALHNYRVELTDQVRNPELYFTGPHENELAQVNKDLRTIQMLLDSWAFQATKQADDLLGGAA